jgi:chaperone required for assembly of F1-ATPase
LAWPAFGYLSFRHIPRQIDAGLFRSLKAAAPWHPSAFEKAARRAISVIGWACSTKFLAIAAHNHVNPMREIFTDIFENQPLDPTEAARRSIRPRLRKRFFERAQIGEMTEGGAAILLDGKPVRTPARRPLAAPTRALAAAIAAEWEAQKDDIDPARMPLTRLANAAVDAVADAPDAVAAEIEKFLGSDLVCYRADAPEGLVARQAQHWDPVLAWARDRFAARFIVAEGVVFAEQPRQAVAAMRARIPRDPWRLAAVSSVTTLTGSALLALALAEGALDAEAVWTAAHADEDWQMEQWGRDEIALARREFRYGEMRAAATVLRLSV